MILANCEGSGMAMDDDGDAADDHVLVRIPPQDAIVTTSFGCSKVRSMGPYYGPIGLSRDP